MCVVQVFGVTPLIRLIEELNVDSGHKDKNTKYEFHKYNASKGTRIYFRFIWASCGVKFDGNQIKID
jgi:hypothetical protein